MQASKQNTQDHRFKEVKVLVGIAVDLSGSMKESIRNNTGGQWSRLDGFRHSLDRLAKETQMVLKKKRAREIEASVDLIVYGFGLRDIAVCDFLSLLKVARDIAQQDKPVSNSTYQVNISDPYKYLELIARRYNRSAWTARILQKYFSSEQDARKLARVLQLSPEAARELAETLPENPPLSLEDFSTSAAEVFSGNFSLSSILEIGMGGAQTWENRRKYKEAKDLAEKLKRRFGSEDFQHNIRNKVLDERLTTIGETVLPLEELGQLLDTNGAFSEDIEQIIYGNTPMREALTKIANRFKRELDSISKDITSILFILSDGESTDGDPSPAGNTLKELGVTVISCFITNEDIVNPYKLLDKPNPSWNRGARLMFDLASPLAQSADYSGFLREYGWTIYPMSKLFLQINHSEILEQFLRVVLSPLREQDED